MSRVTENTDLQAWPTVLSGFCQRQLSQYCSADLTAALRWFASKICGMYVNRELQRHGVKGLLQSRVCVLGDLWATCAITTRAERL